MSQNCDPNNRVCMRVTAVTMGKCFNSCKKGIVICTHQPASGIYTVCSLCTTDQREYGVNGTATLLNAGHAFLVYDGPLSPELSSPRPADSPRTPELLEECPRAACPSPPLIQAHVQSPSRCRALPLNTQSSGHALHTQGYCAEWVSKRDRGCD